MKIRTVSATTCEYITSYKDYTVHGRIHDDFVNITDDVGDEITIIMKECSHTDCAWEISKGPHLSTEEQNQITINMLFTDSLLDTLMRMGHHCLVNWKKVPKLRDIQ